MNGDLVRQWQAGWAASRGYSAVDEADGVLTVKIGEQARSSEYVVLDADANPERLARAAEEAQASWGTAWVTVATDDRDRTGALLEHHHLAVQGEPEWLMTIALADQPVTRLASGYEIVQAPHDDVIVLRAMYGAVVASSGRMAVVGSDAVADRIETDPLHRRRGLGSAMMAGLVDQARGKGAQRGILIASEDGFRLYQSLGWEVAAQVVVARSR